MTTKNPARGSPSPSLKSCIFNFITTFVCFKMIFSSLCLLSLCFAYAVADLTDDSFISITVPSTVEAGTPFHATVNVQMHGLATTSYAHAFRIYLGSSYTDKSYYFYHPDCYLIKEQSLCDSTIKIDEDSVNLNDTPITVTIPPSVGPSGKHYNLIGRIFNTDGSYYGSTWESNIFDLTGGNGTWSTFQQTGNNLWGDDGTACTGFACVKECADRLGSNSQDTTYEACANGCPDVDIAFESSSYGGQPTAALTQPTACPDSPSTTNSATRTGLNGVSTTRTSTRTAAAAASTGGATSNLYINRLSSILSLLAMAISLR